MARRCFASLGRTYTPSPWGNKVDVVVVGGGIMGSAASAAIARRNPELRVALIEQFSLLHRRGSSHGESRIVRKSYPQNIYTQMMNEGYSMWERAEMMSGYSVYTHTRGIDFAPKDSKVLNDIIESCRENSIQHEVLSSRQVSQTYPGLRIPEDNLAVLCEDAGVVHATKSVAMFHHLARDRGVYITENNPVKRIEIAADAADGVELLTENGPIRASKVVLTSGPWTKELVLAATGMRLNLKPIHTSVGYWKSTNPAHFKAGSFPVVIDYSSRHIYSTPILEYPGLVKVALHTGPEIFDMQTRTYEPNHSDLMNVVAPWIKNHYLGVDTNRAEVAEACTYTMTPTEDFLVDILPPPFDNIVVGAGFSGHGFKFAPLMGEILADLCLESRHDTFDLSHFSLKKNLSNAI